jgi:putative ABC transport system substrate-binding protein
MPAVFPREQSDAGGLFSYGTSLREATHRMASHATRILNGDRPGELPIEALGKGELVVNLRTARVLGLTVAPQTVGSATQVIE